MEEQWEYSGQIWIDRAGEGAGGLIYLPWVVYSPLDEELPYEQLMEIAMQIGQDFLAAFETSDPERRSAFGGVGGFEITSVITVIR